LYHFFSSSVQRKIRVAAALFLIGGHRGKAASGNRPINSLFAMIESTCSERPMVRYRISPKFLAIIAEEGLVIHDPNFFHYSFGRNLCIRSDIGHFCDASAFSPAGYATVRAPFAPAVIQS
jgi:hypothetical protein